MNKNKNFDRATMLAVGVSFLTMFVLVNNFNNFSVASIIYLAMSGFALFNYSQWGNFGRKGKLVGIDKNFIQDGFIGFGLGIGTIFLGTIAPLIGAIGIPQVQSIADTASRFIVIVILAPILEEIFFRDFLLDYFDEKLFDMPFVVANVLQAVVFAIFHITAYAGSGSLSSVAGSFFSAGLMGFIFGYVRKFQNSVAGSIAYHMVLNAYIGFVSLSVIFG